MTRGIVLDASVALTLILRQSGLEDVKHRLRAWGTSGTEMRVPSPFWLEVANSLLRRHHFDGRSVVEAIHQLDELGMETVEVDRAMTLLAIDRAERFSLTTYDATYLALAELVDASLYTADLALLAAAGSRGLPVAGGAEHRLSEAAVSYLSERPPTWPDYSGVSAYLSRLRVEVRRPA